MIFSLYSIYFVVCTFVYFYFNIFLILLFPFYEFSSWLLLISLHSLPFTIYCDCLNYDPREEDAMFRPSETDASKDEPSYGRDGQFFNLKIMEGKITDIVRVEINTRSLLCNHNGMCLS